MSEEKQKPVLISVQHRVLGHDGESWKSVPGFEGLYVVSNMGRVARILKSGDSKVLNPSGNSGIGRVVGLYSGGKSKILAVSNIVAMAFLGTKVTRRIRRIDGNLLNDCLDNLEPCRKKSGCRNQDPGKKVKGVWPEKRNGVIFRWIAQFKGTTDSFSNRQEAVRARDRWKREYLADRAKRRAERG
jgi:hypothetical protein